MSIELVPPREELSQGDLLGEAPAVYVADLGYLVKVEEGRFHLQQSRPPSMRPERRHQANAQGVRRLGLVITHDCEIDKPSATSSVQVAAVRALADVPAEHHENFRDRRQHRAFYLPEGPLLEAEHYADLRMLTTIRRTAVDELERVASMNDDGRLMLQEQLFRFYVRRFLPPEWTEWEGEGA